MYQVARRDLPFSKSERDSPVSLGVKIATEGYRPELTSSWSAAFQVLVTMCWSDKADLRPSLPLVATTLTKILLGEQGFITSSPMKGGVQASTEDTPNRKKETHGPELPAGDLWRCIETEPHSVKKSQVILGAGAFATVYRCEIEGKEAALKVFRNSSEEKIFAEIAVHFSLRHPNIIKLYAWFREQGTITQIGAVIEFAGSGGLNDVLKSKDFSLLQGMEILSSAAIGVAHMHGMSVPVVHRDLKSANIMVMADGTTGKVGDCGESRRVDTNSTMTSTGSPLWAAPEILAGKRYCEDVDTYSFGVIMYEVATRKLPYHERIADWRRNGGKGMDRSMLRGIASGLIALELSASSCKEFGVGR